MEILLHYMWKHRLYKEKELRTLDGRRIEVVDPGVENGDAGPDFCEAKIKMGNMLWVGQVEIHEQASDWNRHHHERDKRYNAVVLHVVEVADEVVRTEWGEVMPTMVMKVPIELRLREELWGGEKEEKEKWERARRMLNGRAMEWLTGLTVERVEEKAGAMMKLYERLDCSWERTMWVAVARAMGFAVNAEAMEAWAMTIDPQQVGKHRDDLLQVEAMFLGQGGFFEEGAVSVADMDDYYKRLAKEYEFLKRKFGLVPRPHGAWKLLRLRPANFPHIRLVQLARLYHERKLRFSDVLEAEGMKGLRKRLEMRVTPYWEEHFDFGRANVRKNRKMGRATIDLLLINTFVPLLYAYGRAHDKKELMEKAMKWLHLMPAEKNKITKEWERMGLKVDSAAGSQALIQWRKKYGDEEMVMECKMEGKGG